MIFVCLFAIKQVPAPGPRVLGSCWQLLFHHVTASDPAAIRESFSATGQSERPASRKPSPPGQPPQRSAGGYGPFSPPRVQLGTLATLAPSLQFVVLTLLSLSSFLKKVVAPCPVLLLRTPSTFPISSCLQPRNTPIATSNSLSLHLAHRTNPHPTTTT
jgi:hypothetical protein